MSKKNHLLRTIIALCVCALLLCTCLASCAPGGEDTSKDDPASTPESDSGVDKTPHEFSVLLNYNAAATISTQSPNITQTPKVLLAELIRAYTEEKPWITINMVESNDPTAGGIATLAAAGQMPDIFYIDTLYSAILNDWAADITTFFNNDPNNTNYLESVKDQMTFDGKLYGLANAALPMMMMVNLDYLDEFNVAPPSYGWTLDEFATIMETCTRKGVGCGMVIAEELMHFLPAMYDNTRGSRGFDLVNYTWNFDDAYVVPFNYVKTLADKRVSIEDGINQYGREWIDGGDPESDKYKEILANRQAWLADYLDSSAAPFHAGKLASCFNFNYTGNFDLASNENYIGFDWDIYPVPVFNEGDTPGSGLHPSYIGMSTGVAADTQQAVYDFMSYLSMDIDAYKVQANYSKNYDMDAAASANPDIPIDEIPAILPLAYFIPVNDIEVYNAYVIANPHVEGKQALKDLFEKNYITSSVLDLGASVPMFNEIQNGYVRSVQISEILHGNKTAYDLAPEFTRICNENLEAKLAEMRGETVEAGE